MACPVWGGGGDPNSPGEGGTPSSPGLGWVPHPVLSRGVHSGVPPPQARDLGPVELLWDGDGVCPSPPKKDRRPAEVFWDGDEVPHHPHCGEQKHKVKTEPSPILRMRLVTIHPELLFSSSCLEISVKVRV